jgi:hypothetical protein
MRLCGDGERIRSLLSIVPGVTLDGKERGILQNEAKKSTPLVVLDEASSFFFLRSQELVQRRP